MSKEGIVAMNSKIAGYTFSDVYIEQIANKPKRIFYCVYVAAIPFNLAITAALYIYMVFVVLGFTYWNKLYNEVVFQFPLSIIAGYISLATMVGINFIIFIFYRKYLTINKKKPLENSQVCSKYTAMAITLSQLAAIITAAIFTVSQILGSITLSIIYGEFVFNAVSFAVGFGELIVGFVGACIILAILRAIVFAFMLQVIICKCAFKQLQPQESEV